jgi:nucleoside-diphosphate-sugar epimerase
MKHVRSKVAIERGLIHIVLKIKQDELLIEYGIKHHIPYAIVRPGPVYGPNSKQLISSELGLILLVYSSYRGKNRLP